MTKLDLSNLTGATMDELHRMENAILELMTRWESVKDNEARKQECRKHLDRVRTEIDRRTARYDTTSVADVLDAIFGEGAAEEEFSPEDLAEARKPFVPPCNSPFVSR